MSDYKKQPEEKTEIVNPISSALNQMINQKAARPQDVYRLAIIIEGILDALDDPDALRTIRHELRVLINDISQSINN